MPVETLIDKSLAVEDLLKELRAGLLMQLRDEGPTHLPTRAREIAGSLLELAGDGPALAESAGHLHRALIDAKAGQYDVGALLDLVSKAEAAVLSSAFTEADLLDLGDLLDASFTEARTQALRADNNSDDHSPDKFEIDPEMLEVFAMEADELLGSVDTNLRKLQADPADREALWEIRRSAHTLKGSAGIVGLNELSRLAHRLEDLLDRLYETEAPVRDDMIDLISIAAGQLRQTAAGGNSRNEALKKLYVDLEAALGGEGISEADPGSTTPSSLTANVEINSHEHVPRAIVRVPAEVLDRLAAAARDLAVSRSAFERRLSELEKQIDDLHNMTRRLQSTGYRLEVDLEAALLNTGQLADRKNAATACFDPAAAFDPLELDRYTELHQSIRELTEAANDSFAIKTGLDAVKEKMGDLFQHHDRLVGQVQAMVLDLKKVRFGTIATRLERSASVAVEGEDKAVSVVIDQPNLEIDSRLLDALSEPLMHLMRNAAVHGIETREMRRLLGKPEKGIIKVEAKCTESHLEICVSDDGRGIDHDALRKKAVAVGLVRAEETDTLGENASADLIFVRGLSTAAGIGMYAGRGVGMSIIRECLEALNGSIAVGRGPRGGTSFSLTVPLAYAVLRVLVVRIGRFVIGVPRSSVTKVVELDPGSEAYEAKLGDTSAPILRLDEHAGAYGLVTGEGPKRFVVAVDEIFRTEELALKPLPVVQFPGIRGAAVLGNGEAVPVVNLAALSAVGSRKTMPPLPTSEAGINILVVDDSPSVRHLTSKLIEREGWSCSTAKNGAEALEMLRSAATLPQIVLTDIEMPRMDGYQLAEALSRDERLGLLPVVFITSRTNEKHRRRAAEIGITEYLTKPFDAAALRTIVNKLISVT